MVMTCPVCARRSPKGAIRCDCGYDFVTNEMGPPNERIRNERRAAARAVNHGIVILAGTAAVVLGSVLLGLVAASFIPFIFGGLAAVAGGTVGIVSLAVGIGSSRRLRSRNTPAALPPARMIE
jgi:hypothetical protein